MRFKVSFFNISVFITGCFGSPAEMRGDMGTFGISDDQTLSYMTCSWKIQVEHSKVMSLHMLILYVTSTNRH